MEWYYNPPSDEPTVYETDPPDESKPAHRLFSEGPPPPFEEPVSEPEEQYLGDPDVVEHLVSPVEAFHSFANHTFSFEQTPVSASIYEQASTKVVQPVKVEPLRRGLPARESRQEKLKRIEAELDALKSEIGGDDTVDDNSALYQLSSLRDNLDKIELSMYSKQDNLPSLSSLSNVQQQPENETEQKTLQIISPDVSLISALEQRLARMETAVGVCPTDSEYTVPLGKTLADVSTRLALISDPTLSSRLKQDAQKVAQLFQEHLRSEKGQKLLQAAQSLESLQRHEKLIRSVPVVVERLTSLRKTQDEAAAFSTSIDVLAKQIDEIEKRSRLNAELLDNVTQSLEANMKIVEDNLEVLENRLNFASESVKKPSKAELL